MRAQADITVNGTGHYNPDKDALLRLETMSANEVRVSLHASMISCGGMTSISS